jgi:hypothetical protein
MKLTLLLLSLVKISLGYVCEKNGFKAEQKSNDEYQGKFNPAVYTSEFVMPNSSRNLPSAKILDISNGNLVFEDKANPKSYKQNYLFSNVDCYEATLDGKPAEKKKCLLEYISIEDKKNDSKLKEKRLTFEVNVKDEGCIEAFKKELAEKETCKIDEFQTDFPNFYVPLDGGKDGFLKFMSLTGTLSHFTGGKFNQINQSQIQITFGGESAELKFQNKSYKFKTDNSCYFLLKKLNEWAGVRGCSNDVELLTFANIEISPLNENIPKQEGHLDLLQNSRFLLNGGESLILKEIEIKDIETINYLYFEGFQFTMELRDEANFSYRLFYKHRSKECIDKIKQKLIIYKSCAFDDKSNLLYYYDQVNLQSPDSAEKITGEYELIHFDHDKAEILANDLKKINSVKVYYMNLVQKEQQWLYIKGLDVNNNLFNKKFLVKSCDNCYKMFMYQLNEYYNKKVKVLLWEHKYFYKKEDYESQLVMLGEIVISEEKKPLKIIENDDKNSFCDIISITKMTGNALNLSVGETDQKGKVRSKPMRFNLGFNDSLEKITRTLIIPIMRRKIK